MKPSISIIIPAYNEEKYISSTLAALQANTFQDKEIIVVCNGCKDSTIEIVKKYPSVRIISINERNVSTARNVGAKIALSDNLVFLDADTKVSRHALDDIVNKLSSAKCIGTLKVKADKPRFLAKCFMACKNISHYFHLYKGCSGIIFCQKEVFENVGGFNENMKKREDTHLIKNAIAQINCKYAYINSSYVITSMRRYESLGYLGVILYWLKYWSVDILFRKDRDYPVIR